MSAVSKAIAIILLTSPITIVAVAHAQTLLDSFLFGCFESCNTPEIRRELGREDIRHACSKYCTCSLDDIQKRHPGGQWALVLMNPLGGPARESIETAQRNCLDHLR